MLISYNKHFLDSFCEPLICFTFYREILVRKKLDNYAKHEWNHDSTKVIAIKTSYNKYDEKSQLV